MSQDILNAARQLWGLGDANIVLIARRENHVYRVDGAQQVTALRLHRQGYRSVQEIHAELQWMDRLAQHGIPVPQPVNAADGVPVQVINGTIVDMLTWVEGTPLSQVDQTEAHYRSLGCLLAKMHQLADQWSTARLLSRPTWDLVGRQPTWDRFWENPLLTGVQKSFFSRFRETAAEALDALQQPDIGLIHADLVPDNVLVNGESLHPIDFDDGGFGYRLFDVATVTFKSRRIEDGEALANAALAGYSAERPLDLDSLPLFEALRACTYVGWNISRMQEQGGAQRNAQFIEAAESAVTRYLKR